MSLFAVITESDESTWDDITGESYHFPKRYLNYLEPGTKVIYYKGAIREGKFLIERLSEEPHCFGIAEVSCVYPDPKSHEGDHFAEIQNYQRFKEAVLAKQNGSFLELVPESHASSHWRNGVRPITEKILQTISIGPSLKQPRTRNGGFFR